MKAGTFQLEHWIDLILVLLQKDLKVRYKATVLGYLWSVMHPLVLAMVFLFAFRVILKNGIPEYPLVLVSGLFPWQWMSNSVTGASGIFLGNRSLLKRVAFPRSTLVLSHALNEATHFVFSVPIIVGFMIWYGHWPTVSWLWLAPLTFVLQLTMAVGLMLLVATANVFFRDMERLVGLFMMLAFYMTPIIYPASLVPDHLRWILFLNPFAGLTDAWHAVFQDRPLDLALLGGAAFWSVACFLIGSFVYRRYNWRFAELV